MSILYMLAIWAHIFTVAFWVGAMFFGDPQSTRFFSKLFERKLGGVGWYAHAVLWTTGFFMLWYRGISPARLFSADLIGTNWGRALWLKILLVLLLLAFQLFVGHKASKLIYGYMLVAFTIVCISVVLVRPVLL